MAGGNISGGDKSKSGGDNSLTRQLAGVSNRFEREARPSRNLALTQLAGILSGGVDWLGKSMGAGSYIGPDQGGGAAAPQKYRMADIMGIYDMYDPGKGSDALRIGKGLPEEFTLDELKAGANFKGLSSRSRSAWERTIGELETNAKNGGSNLGGVSGGPGGSGSMFLPIAQTAIEQSRQATSRSLAGLTQQFAGMKGVGANNPFAIRALTEGKIAGDQATSQIPSRIIEAYMQNVLPLAFGQSPTATQGLSNAAQIQGTQNAASAAESAKSGNQTAQMLGNIAQAVAAYYTMGGSTAGTAAVAAT